MNYILRNVIVETASGLECIPAVIHVPEVLTATELEAIREKANTECMYIAYASNGGDDQTIAVNYYALILQNPSKKEVLEAARKIELLAKWWEETNTKGKIDTPWPTTEQTEY